MVIFGSAIFSFFSPLLFNCTAPPLSHLKILVNERHNGSSVLWKSLEIQGWRNEYLKNKLIRKLFTQDRLFNYSGREDKIFKKKKKMKGICWGRERGKIIHSNFLKLLTWVFEAFPVRSKRFRAIFRGLNRSRFWNFSLTSQTP